MELKHSSSIQTYTAFVFGKEGSGYDHFALQEARGGKILVLACAAVDGLVGKSMIDGLILPDFDYVDITSVEDFEGVLAELNKMRAEGQSYDSIIFFGLGQYAAFVALKLVPNGQPSQQQFGAIARFVNNHIRLLRGYASKVFVTCAVKEVEEDGTDRLDVQPAIYNAVAGELAHAYFISAKKDGTRLIQSDPLLALNFISGSNGNKAAEGESVDDEAARRRAERKAARDAKAAEK